MFSVPIRVRFYETDMMGVVHHTNHIRWFEMARVIFMEKAGVNLWDMMDEDDIVFPIKSVKCEYIEPARFDDMITVEAYLVKLTRAQMVFSYRVIRDRDGALIATGETQTVFTSRTTGKMIRVEDRYFKPLYAFVEGNDKNGTAECKKP